MRYQSLRVRPAPRPARPAPAPPALTPAGQIVSDPEGYLWVLRDATKALGPQGDIVSANPDHERDILVRLRGLGSPRAVFIDVGAHLGYYCVRLARHFGAVHAFEPSPVNRAGLLANLALNRLEDVRVHAVALGETSGTARVVERGGGTVVVPEAGDGAPVVPVVRLDDRLPDIDGPVVLKIDTEGAELPILRGAERLLRRVTGHLLVEHHEHIYGGLAGVQARIVAFLESLGYALVEDYPAWDKMLLASRRAASPSRPHDGAP